MARLVPLALASTILVALSACGVEDETAGPAPRASQASAGGGSAGSTPAPTSPSSSSGSSAASGSVSAPSTGAPSTAPSSSSTPTPSPTATSAAPTPTPPPASNGAVGPRVSTFAQSGPITAVSGQVISGVRIQNPGGVCIYIPDGVTNVVVRDSDIGPCGGEANILAEGAGALIEHVSAHDGNRGVLVMRTNDVTTRASRFETFSGPAPRGTAIEYDWMTQGVIDGNVVRGSHYKSDAMNVFESSNVVVTHNDVDVSIDEPSSAPFIIGDATNNEDPGANNTISYNVFRAAGGGVLAGIMGSSGNTLVEKNCFVGGLQAWNYSGTYVGVTIRDNVIGPDQSSIDRGVIAVYAGNIDSSNCALVPK